MKTKAMKSEEWSDEAKLLEDWRESDEEAEKWERDVGDRETKWEIARGERIN